MQQQAILTRTLLMLLVYLAIYYIGGSLRQLMYPIIWLVAFLHETGHALGALLTGGEVVTLQINPNGSGFTATRGGNIAFILIGGYVGSAILGNVLFYIGARKRRLAQSALMVLAGLMLFSILKWPGDLLSNGLLLLYAIVLFFIAVKTNWDQHVAMFFGLASVLYVIQDFNVGPSSDLKAYEQYIGVFPAHIWMYVWLFVVLLISYYNFKNVFGDRWWSGGYRSTRKYGR